MDAYGEHVTVAHHFYYITFTIIYPYLIYPMNIYYPSV